MKAQLEGTKVRLLKQMTRQAVVACGWVGILVF